jgi:sulfiredoxin
MEPDVCSWLIQTQKGDIFTPVEIIKVRSVLKSDPDGPVHNFYMQLGGCHRFEASKRLGLESIRARIIEAPASQMRIYLGAGSPF